MPKIFNYVNESAKDSMQGWPVTRSDIKQMKTASTGGAPARPDIPRAHGTGTADKVSENMSVLVEGNTKHELEARQIDHCEYGIGTWSER